MRKSAMGCALACMVGGFAFADVAVAHNINLEEARESVRKRGRSVVADKKLPYVKYRTHCRYKFKGHSHWALCTITFETKNDVNACQEKLDAYIQIRGSGIFDPFARDGVFKYHIPGSRLCGRTRILRTVPPTTG